MTIQELKDYFVTGYRFEQQTGISSVSFQNWIKWDYIPIRSQFKIEQLTNGKFKADIKHDRGI